VNFGRLFLKKIAPKPLGDFLAGKIGPALKLPPNLVTLVSGSVHFVVTWNGAPFHFHDQGDRMLL
jgi:hypothetical protein